MPNEIARRIFLYAVHGSPCGKDSGPLRYHSAKNLILVDRSTALQMAFVLKEVRRYVTREMEAIEEPARQARAAHETASRIWRQSACEDNALNHEIALDRRMHLRKQRFRLEHELIDLISLHKKLARWTEQGISPVHFLSSEQCTSCRANTSAAGLRNEMWKHEDMSRRRCLCTRLNDNSWVVQKRERCSGRERTKNNVSRFKYKLFCIGWRY